MSWNGFMQFLGRVFYSLTAHPCEGFSRGGVRLKLNLHKGGWRALPRDEGHSKLQPMKNRSMMMCRFQSQFNAR
jgi:hypothetical protein